MSHHESWAAHMSLNVLPETSSRFIPESTWINVIAPEVMRHFRPEVLTCAPGQNKSTCLTGDQIGALHRIYTDYYEADQTYIFGGYQPGGEKLYPTGLVGSTTFPLVQDWFRFFVLNDTQWTPDLYNASLIAVAEQVNPGQTDAISPKLTAFASAPHNGKVLHYIGWADQLISPGYSLHYYETVHAFAQENSTLAIDDFYRLFPGGEAANAFGAESQLPSLSLDAEHNILAAMVRWVEEGVAPSKVVGVKYKDDLPANGIAFTRPICKIASRPSWQECDCGNKFIRIAQAQAAALEAAKKQCQVPLFPTNVLDSALSLSLPPHLLMDSLPVETLQQIFEHACTDGGSTGNALSLTSKHIRAAARRARFHTLRIAVDSNKFPEFIGLFERECNRGRNERPRVRHLHLTLASVPFIHPDIRALLAKWRNPQPCPPSHIEAGQSLHSLAVLPPEGAPLLPPPLTRSQEYALQELVRLVAPDLWSLVIHAVPYGLPDHFQSPILKHTFPLLREVALIGLPGPARLLLANAKLSPIFPQATHIYLSPRLNSHDLHLSSWFALAPRVTHLHVSGIQSQHHVQQLAEAVGVHVQINMFTGVTTPSDSPLPRSETPRTYPSVHCLLMEPAEKPTGRKCGNFALAQVAMRNGLSDIVRECRRPDVDIQAALLERPDTVPYVQHAKVLEHQWVERVGGGEGWWKGLELDRGACQG
ncbi:hypothetical protein TRAPUB_1665 [Trametes pubescens]|uniref:Carboxylic ester hydrolase n=1 Tax=Trametes pubescens TaxID=154538 RepID=A0A1M2VIT3_TRAPU|nr:hypothetical protein TRAPUB_1665 [Trametes pubescens]